MKKNKKGFTLAELLIVVAIVAVLTAIAIPVFTSSLEKARAATDAANIRAGYASVAAKGILENGDGWYWLMADGSVYKVADSGTAIPSGKTRYQCRGKASNLDGETIIGSQNVNNNADGVDNGINWDKNDYIGYQFTAASIAVNGSGTTINNDGSVKIFKKSN